MAYLEIDKVFVHSEQSGEWGGDELYFKVNGQKVGPTTSSLHTSEGYDFSPEYTHFSGSISVSLFEDDPEWPFGNGDDHVTSVSINDAPGQGILTWMDGAGGMYDVYFNVWA